MANSFNKTINLNINGTAGLKTLDDLKLKAQELEATISTLDITSPDFKATKAELEAVTSQLKTFGQSSQEASDIATEAFVKTSQAIVGTTGTLLTFAASNDQADKVTAKLAKTLALVDSIEKISQATKAVSIFLQDKANEATAEGTIQTGLFARAQLFLTNGLNGVGTALKNLYVVLLANPFTAVIATLGLITAGIFAFSKSTEELIAEQQKLYEQTVATNDAILAYNDAIRESIVLDTKRKNLRKGEELERKFAIDSIKDAQINADKEILDFEKKVAKERKAIVDSFYFSVFGFTTEQLQKFKDFEIELEKLKTKRANLDNKLANQETKNSEAVNKTLNEDNQKRIQLRQSQLANFEDYSSKLELLSLDLESTLSDIQEREANGDKNTFTDRQIALQNYRNKVKLLNDQIIKDKEDAYLRQVEIDEKFDEKVRINNKRKEDEDDKNAAEEQQRQQDELDRQNKILEAQIALGEVENEIIKSQIDNSKTSFNKKIELTNKLFEIEKKRIEFNRDQALKNINLSLEEQEVIKAKADAEIKTLTNVKNETIKINEELIKSFDALGVKSEEDLKKLITGLNASVDALNSFNSILDQAGVNEGLGLRALNTSLSSVLQGFTKISEDGKITFEEITNESLKSLSTISVAVNESIQASIEQNIESIDEAIDAIEEKRKQVEANINDSLSKQKDLESKLSEARVGDREKILKAIDAERAREKQLAKDKVRFAEEERKLEEKKKEEKRKAFIANKAASAIQAAIATSVAIITAQEAPPPAGQILAILAGISGALQVASILAQPIPEFRKGGPTLNSNDDSKVAGIVHANEYVIPAKMVRSPRFKSTVAELEMARQTGSFQSGGLTTPNSNDAESKLEKVLQTSIELSNRPIVVTVVDINTGQQRYAQVIDEATL